MGSFLSFLWLAGAILALGVLYVLLPTALCTYRRLRGPRVAVCPETRAVVGVELDTTHAAMTSMVGEPAIRIARCERWPQYGHCDQACLDGVDATWAKEHALLTHPPAAMSPASGRP